MLTNYLKIALKVLARRKFFTFVSLFGIAFTLLVLLIVAALADHLLVPRSPESRFGRVLQLRAMRMYGEDSDWISGPGYLFLDRYARDLPHVAEMAIYSRNDPVTHYLGGDRVVSQLKRTDGAYWRILDFRFLEGAPFTDADERDGNRVAVISARTRRILFGGEPAVGRDIELDGEAFRVVGVVGDVPAFLGTAAADIWAPLSTNKIPDYRQNLMGGYQGLFLARSRRDFPAIKAEFQSRLPRVEFTNPEDYHTMQGELETRLEVLCHSLIWSEPGHSTVGRVLLLVVLGGLLFMSLPAINLVNINLSRIYERGSEIGVRKAFGASSAHLVGQFVVENVVLCVIGGLIGLLLAGMLMQVAPGLAPAGLYLEFRLNLRIFAYAVLLAIFFGLLSGAWPAWRMSRQHPVTALRGGVR